VASPDCDPAEDFIPDEYIIPSLPGFEQGLAFGGELSLEPPFNAAPSGESFYLTRQDFLQQTGGVSAGELVASPYFASSTSVVPGYEGLGYTHFEANHSDHLEEAYYDEEDNHDRRYQQALQYGDYDFQDHGRSLDDGDRYSQFDQVPMEDAGDQFISGDPHMLNGFAYLDDSIEYHYVNQRASRIPYSQEPRRVSSPLAQNEFEIGEEGEIDANGQAQDASPTSERLGSNFKHGRALLFGIQQIKPEPVDDGRVLQERNAFEPARSSSSRVKPDPDAVEQKFNAPMNLIDEKPIVTGPVANVSSAANKENKDHVAVAPSAPQYAKYASSEEIPDMEDVPLTSPSTIQYTPEDALKTGLGIVSVIKDKIRLLDIGSKMRKDVWKKELDELSAHSTPTTMIAICGATGAGKSSVINAVLDDTIVPTSGMRACTAVVTEIGYKPGRSIEADVSFLSREEWKAELQILLEDLHDEDGKVKAPTDMKSEAGVAWSKVHAVYPQIPLDFLVTLTADQIIARDPGIERILGTTKKISAANSKEF
ncbi:hypothetical protein FRC01_010271, partial [Tulasnella sp. 417]